MRALCALAMVALLAACGQPQQTAPDAEPAPVAETQEQARAACYAEAASEWRVGDTVYRVETAAEGVTCGEAIATITVRGPDGAVAFTEPYPVAQVPLAFSPNADEARLQAEVLAWAQNIAQGPTAATLPAWPDGAVKPPHFQPEVARDEYETARTEQRAIFCYPDGGESNACLAADPAGGVTLLGSWTPERP